MITTFNLICSQCGLSDRAAAEFLNVRLDTVKSWSSGRNQAPDGVIRELRNLYATIENAANKAIAEISKIEGGIIELGLASDDYEAQQPPLNWPCVGAQAAMLGIVAAKVDKKIIIVPRGSTPATAAAIDAHEKKDPPI